MPLRPSWQALTHSQDLRPASVDTDAASSPTHETVGRGSLRSQPAQTEPQWSSTSEDVDRSDLWMSCEAVSPITLSKAPLECSDRTTVVPEFFGKHPYK